MVGEGGGGVGEDGSLPAEGWREQGAPGCTGGV